MRPSSDSSPDILIFPIPNMNPIPDSSRGLRASRGRGVGKGRKIRPINRSHSPEPRFSACTSVGRFLSDSWASCLKSAKQKCVNRLWRAFCTLHRLQVAEFLLWRFWKSALQSVGHVCAFIANNWSYNLVCRRDQISGYFLSYVLTFLMSTEPRWVSFYRADILPSHSLWRNHSPINHKQMFTSVTIWTWSLPLNQVRLDFSSLCHYRVLCEIILTKISLSLSIVKISLAFLCPVHCGPSV